MPGAQHRIIHAPGPVYLTPILTRKIIPNAIHRTDIEEAAQATVGQGSFSGSRWNSDYAARGERGDPRGRNSGAGQGAMNPR